MLSTVNKTKQLFTDSHISFLQLELITFADIERFEQAFDDHANYYSTKE